MSDTDSLPLVTQSRTTQLTYQFLNSLAAYIIAFWLIYMISNLGACLMASAWNWQSYLLYYGFNAKPLEGMIYQRRSVITVFAVAPFLCLIFALLAKFVHNKYARTNNTLVKTVLFWLILHGINMSMGSIIISTFMILLEQKRIFRGIGHSFEWLRAEDAHLYGIVAIATIIQVTSGFVLTNLSFLNAQNRKVFSEKNNKEKIQFTFANVVFPWILGGLITFFFRLPYISELDITLIFLMGSLVIPILSFTTHRHKISLARVVKGSKFSLFVSLILIAIVLSVGIRLLFADKGIMISNGW
jgi:hypothetical protein